MNKRAQIRWVIIIVLLAIIAGFLLYPGVTRKILGMIIAYSKPVTGFASGVAENLVQNITP